MAGMALGVVAAAVALTTAAQGAPSTSSRSTDSSSTAPLVSNDEGAERFSSLDTKPMPPRSHVQIFGRRIPSPRTEPIDPPPAPEIPTCRMPMVPADPRIDPKFVLRGPTLPPIVHHIRRMPGPLPCVAPDAGSANR